MSSARQPELSLYYIEPMKALGVTETPTGEWHCEIKFDGYRAVALLNRGRAELWSRTRKPFGSDYPAIIEALSAIKCRNAVLDGEIVALDAQGRSRFQLLQVRELNTDQPAAIAYYIFDIMHHDGRDVTGWSIEERRKLLTTLLKKPRQPLRVSPLFDVEPAELMRAARDQGLEGIVVKRHGSVYEPGRRSGAWLKCKILGEQELVIGGFTPPQRSREFFGALLVGYFQRGKLMYAGKVGTGFSRATLEAMHAVFLKRVRASCPFSNLPLNVRSRFGTGMTASEMKKVTWLRPDLVAQVRFAEWTDDGLLRQPAFLGLRKDKRAADVRREAGPVTK